MSNTKTVMGQASNQYVVPLDIDEVFSTYLYEGNSSTQTITNDIDLDGEGGLVWIKCRDSGQEHNLYDTERGVYKFLQSQSDAAEDQNVPKGLTAFNSNGFSLDVGNESGSSFNNSSFDYASWTFRKAPKFFDVVTYTGDGTSNRQIPHSIDGPVGFILIKRTDSTGNWLAWHRSVDPGYGILDLTLAFTSGSNGFLDAVADTYFETSWLNTSGATYVAYLFAHNDGDGGFGPDGSDIIKCGSYTGNGSNDGLEIDLGFEPQWVLVKGASSGAAYDWFIWDNIRGMDVNRSGPWLRANRSNAEGSNTGLAVGATSTGFNAGNDANTNGSGETYIYMALRRGPLAPPESATEVFAIDTAGGTSPTPPTFTSGFPVDFSFYKNKTDSSNNWGSQNRLTGYGDLAFNTSSAEFSNNGSYWQKDYMNGIGSNTGTNSNGYQWMWKRAPSFFDVVAYTGDGTAGRTVSHNLGVAPEMMWVKLRDGGLDWMVYHKDHYTEYALLNSTQAYQNSSVWNNTLADADNFTVGSSSYVNLSNRPFIAYLFSSLPGISKVGSYSGNNSSQTIDCGFTTGARLVLIKASSRSGSWSVWDSARGITAGDDPRLELNSTSAEQSQSNIDVEPHSSGFIIDSTSGEFNEAGETYIFYAIA